MTREKKEITKKINEILDFMDIERKMGCGFAPSSYFEKMEREYLYPLYEKLRILSHYSSIEDMLYDTRGCI